mgnify:CR=1 FL=1
MNLREKVLALADNADTDEATARHLALAVAALVAEDCARGCDRVARNQRSDWQGRVDGPAECAAAIRAKAEELGK